MALSFIPPIDVWQSLKTIFEWTWVFIKLFIVTLGWKGFLILGGITILPIVVIKMRDKINDKVTKN